MRAISYLLPSFSLCTLAVAFPLAGCVAYQEDPPLSTGGTSSGGTDAAGGDTANTGGDMGTGGGEGTGGARPDPPDPSCENVAACGGDVAGVWFVDEGGSCLPVTGSANLSPFGIGCSTGDLVGELNVVGNWTLNADGTFSDNTTTTGEMNIVLGPECRDVSGTVVNCGDVAGPLASIGFASLECSDATDGGGGCECTGTVNQSGGAGFVDFDGSTEGIYEIEGNVLTTMNLISVDYEFCVDDQFLHVTPTTMPNNLGTTNGTIVFQKQP